MKNAAIKLNGMSVVRDLETEEEVNVIRDFVLTDSDKTISLIKYLKDSTSNKSGEELAKTNAKIAKLEGLLEAQIDLTCRIYSIDTESEESQVETKTVKETVKKEVNQEAKAAIVDKPATETKKEETPATDKKVEGIIGKNAETVKAAEASPLRVVAVDGKDVKDADTGSGNIKDLKTKYKDLIKKISVEELTSKVKALFAEEKDVEAVEMATFILSGGHYSGKKAKQWSKEKINNFLNQCKPVVAADEDLSVTYAAYLGDNKMSIGGLTAEVKYLLHSGEVERAYGVATYILTNAEYVAGDGKEPAKYSAAEVEEFLRLVRDDLKNNPINLNPEGSKSVDPKAAEAADKAAEKAKLYDLTSDAFFKEIRNVILEGRTEDEVKKFIFDTIKEKNVESFELFHKTEKTDAELNEMYVNDSVKSYVDACFIEYKAIKDAEQELEYYRSLDITIEADKFLDEAIANPENKSLLEPIKQLRDLYVKRNEKVGLKECKKFIEARCEERFPERYKEIMEHVKASAEKMVDKATEKKEPETTVKPFNEEHPELYEVVKDAKNLDDVFTMAKEMEKKQDFQVVRKMITFIISSGKIKDKDGNLCNWTPEQISLWITNMFQDKTNVLGPTEKAASENTDTPKEVAAEVKESQAGTQPAQTVEKAGSDSATPAQSPSVDNNIPEGLVVPEEDSEFVGLYAKNKDGFFGGIQNAVKKMLSEGKPDKTIVQDISDKIKALAQNMELKACFVRHYKSQSISDLYKFVAKVAKEGGIKIQIA